ncbi:MAG: hypothetical protein K6A75_05870 [Ruminococcus sp.]|nr:hypothetical protein [Ruminococcus sp.]
MKEKELFDMLENADDRQIDELAESCPELTSAQLERILAKSEKKYAEKKSAKQTMSGEMEVGDTVSGVERVTRPVWLTPLYTAASLVLVAGLIAGGALLLRHRGGDNIVVPPSGTVTTDESSPVTTTTVVSATGTNTATAAKTASTGTQTTAAAETTTASTAAESVSTSAADDVEFQKIAFDLAERSEEVNLIVNEFNFEVPSIPYEYETIWFAYDDDDRYVADGFEGYNGHNNYTSENGTVKDIPYTILYHKVPDSRFHSTDDLRALVKSVYTDENIFDNEYLCTYGPDLSDLEEGDKFDTDIMCNFIDYRGSLYCLGPGQRGYLGTSYFKELPVIISDKTDTSFTAYVAYACTHEITGSPDDYELLRDCRRFSIVFDSTANDWRIKGQTDISFEEYTALREKAGL